MKSQYTIGIDLGDKFNHFCELNEEGEVIQEGRVAATPNAMARQLAKWPAASLIVIEVGTHSRWVSEAIVRSGHSVIVANPRRVKLISDSANKHDRADAKLLARLARVDRELLAPIEHRGRQLQADLTIIRARDILVRTRGKLVNCGV